jgi:signal transduction histidine kinase
MAAGKNISVKLSDHGKPAFIYADGLHLKRMFLNLLNNAVKFTPEGGRIDISVHYEAKKLKVSIKDTGVGINPEDVDKVFDRFFHVDRINQTSESGSGLGLSIAQSIAKMHRGDITVKSQPAKGSTFTVILPV